MRISWNSHACTLNNDMSSTVCELYRKVNNILADFFFVGSNTLSVLFDSYCIFIYNKMYARRTRSFSRGRMQSSNSARMNKSNFTTEKIV